MSPMRQEGRMNWLVFMLIVFAASVGTLMFSIKSLDRLK